MAGGTSDTSVQGETTPRIHRPLAGLGEQMEEELQSSPWSAPPWRFLVLSIFAKDILSVSPFFDLRAKLLLSKTLFGSIQHVSQD